MFYRLSACLFFLIVMKSALYGQAKYDTLPNLPEHYVRRMAMFQAEPETPGAIVMLGNSITEGGNWKRLLGDSTVLNRGISGDVTFGVLNRLDEVLRHKPSKIYLLIGINDLSRNTPEEVIIENIFSIAKRIQSRSPKTEVFVQSILPINETFKNYPPAFRDKSKSIITINTQLARFADRMKYHFIDVGNSFSGGDGRMEAKYATDGLHLNQLGYQHWVRILRADSKTNLK